MKTVCKTLAVFTVVLTLAWNVTAQEKKEEKKPLGSEVTLKGKIACGRCMYKLEGLTGCQMVIQVKELDKGKETEVYYYFDKDSHRKYHEEYCRISIAKEGSVTGTVSEKDGKKWIKLSKLETK